jgi:phenylacetate-CoA ligase
VPLLRYHIADEGGLVGLEELLAFCRDHGFTPSEPGPDLPFVYVFGRSLFTVSFFGANIYPENVTVGLERPEVSGRVTGKFVLSVVEDEDRDRYVSVVVELAPGVEPAPGDERAIAESIRAELVRLNSEFANYVPAQSQTPRVELRRTGDPEYFPVGVKHRYTRPA